MVVAFLVRYFVPSSRGLRRHGGDSLRWGTGNTVEVERTCSDRLNAIGGGNPSALPSDPLEQEPVFKHRVKRVRAMSTLTSLASDFDVVSDWYYYCYLVRQEQELAATGDNLVPPIFLSLLLFSCILGTIMVGERV